MFSQMSIFSPYIVFIWGSRLLILGSRSPVGVVWRQEALIPAALESGAHPSERVVLLLPGRFLCDCGGAGPPARVPSLWGRRRSLGRQEHPLKLSGRSWSWKEPFPRPRPTLWSERDLLLHLCGQVLGTGSLSLTSA